MKIKWYRNHRGLYPPAHMSEKQEHVFGWNFHIDGADTGFVSKRPGTDQFYANYKTPDNSLVWDVPLDVKTMREAKAVVLAMWRMQ